MLDTAAHLRDDAPMIAPPPEPLITLTSDFGTRDGYAGAMKGVIRSVCPHVRLEDITHDIPPGDVRAGAWALRSAVGFFPRGTVHVAVIDPGVGTSRNAIVLQADSHYLIGPDNGLFSWILRESRHVEAWKLSDASWRPARASNTFHGRDLFSHAAALLVREGDMQSICSEPVEPRCADWAHTVAVAESGLGEVVHIDRFGNVITNLLLPQGDPEGPWHVELLDSQTRLEGLHRTYGDVGEGRGLALIGSHNFLEIAVSRGSAAERFDLKPGAPIRVTNG